MESFLQAIFPCLPLGGRGIQLPVDTVGYDVSEKTALHPVGGGKPRLSSEEAASSIVSAMLDADRTGPALDVAIQSLVHQAGGWCGRLAERILATLLAVLEAGEPMNAAMQGAYDRASDAVRDFAAEHPVETAVLCTVVALGVLVVLAPYVLEWLGFCAGFGELGPVEGSWAALWQARYAGRVPRGSLFSYFQRLGMIWKRA